MGTIGNLGWARPLGRSGGRREVVTKTRVSLTEVAYVAPADELVVLRR